MSKIPIDELLKKSLSSTDAPSYELNQKTKIMMKEQINMKKQKGFSVKIALLIAAVLTVSSVTVYAVVKYLTPQELAQKLEYPKLAAAFDSKDSLLINKTVSSNGYDITLLGTAFGKDLTGLSTDVEISKTYAVVAIEKQGGKMPDTSSDEYGEYDFFISPLIKGYKPWQVNIFTMGGGSMTTVVDGIMYRMIECDSVEMFADAGVYIGISSNSGTFCNNQSFNYNFETGEISPNPDSGAVSIIFELPIDKSKADPIKAREFLEQQQLITDEEISDTELNPDSADPNDGEVIEDTPKFEVKTTDDGEIFQAVIENQNSEQ